MLQFISEVSAFLHSVHIFTCLSDQFHLRGGAYICSTYVYASRQVEAALLQKSFSHSIVPGTEDDPVSQQTVLQAIAEIARCLKNFECGNVGIDCFFADLYTSVEFVTFKCLVCLPQMCSYSFLIISSIVSVSSVSQALYSCRPSIPIAVMKSALINSGERDWLWMSATMA